MSEKHAPQAVVVDDNLMFAMMLEPQLRRLGYQVRTLAAGLSVTSDVIALAPDLVVVNLASPRRPGAEVVRELRAREETARVPILAYAGHVEQELLKSGREAGATLVAPNSAIRAALPQVLAKLKRRVAGEPDEEYPSED